MIKVYEPLLTQYERKALLNAFDSGWISGAGPDINICEKKIEKITNSNASLVSNGTTALHLALMAIGIKPGDKVLVPSFAYIAPANAVKMCNAEPVFVDCEHTTWQSTVADYETKFDKNVKAIIVVYNYGSTGNVNEIIKWAKSKNLLVIEDCAEALGSYVNGKHVGSLSDVGTFSFYGNKTITCGEGGAVISKNFEVISRVKKLKGQGLAEYRQYWHDIVGFNYRLNNLSAAMLIPQLERLDNIIQKKKFIFEKYKNALIDYLEFQKFNDDDCPWMVSVLLPLEMDREKFRNYLTNKNIETRPLFYPIHTMPPYFKDFYPLPVCESISSRGINLPSGPGTSNNEIDYIIECILEGIKNHENWV